MMSQTFGNTSDRMLVALVGALALHAALIFGVGFSLPKPARHFSPLIDIELIQNDHSKRPEKADYLAPNDSEGGVPEQRETKPEPIPAAAKRPAVSPRHKPRPKVGRRPKRQEHKRILTQDSASEQVENQVPEFKPQPRLDPRLLARQIADLGVMPRKNLRFSHERVTHIHRIRAHKYVAAAYERAWQEKVERIGNLNYPDEARRKGLKGRLLISVYVAKDGTVRKIKLHRSSGYRVLDDAAVRIVRLAAPFAAFPKELAAQTDVLVITRTWNFYNDAGLAMGR